MAYRTVESCVSSRVCDKENQKHAQILSIYLSIYLPSIIWRATSTYIQPLSRFFCPRLIYSHRSIGKGDIVYRVRKKKIPPPYIEQRTLPILALHLHSNTFTLARASFLLVRWITWPEYLLLYDREISLITGHSNAYHGVDRGFEPVHVINADTRLTFINAAFARSFRKIPLTSTVYHCSRTRHLSVDGNGMEFER